MLKLATAFSGIGAIEHALKRMQVKHELVFACDNDLHVKKVILLIMILMILVGSMWFKI